MLEFRVLGKKTIAFLSVRPAHPSDGTYHTSSSLMTFIEAVGSCYSGILFPGVPNKRKAYPMS